MLIVPKEHIDNKHASQIQTEDLINVKPWWIALTNRIREAPLWAVIHGLLSSMIHGLRVVEPESAP